MAVPVTHVESVSPELVLIDPRLAIDARARLSAPDDTLARLEPDLATSIAEKKAAALLGSPSSRTSTSFPPAGGSYRVPKLSVAIATWSTAAILVADVQLYDWTTWLV